MFKKLCKLEVFQNANSVGVFIPTANEQKIKGLIKKIANEGKAISFISKDSSGNYCFRSFSGTPITTEIDEDAGIELIHSKYHATPMPDLILVECNDYDSSPYDNYLLDKIISPKIGIYNKFHCPKPHKTAVSFILNQKI